MTSNGETNGGKKPKNSALGPEFISKPRRNTIVNSGRELKIAVIGDYLIDWTGGLEFLKHLLNGIQNMFGGGEDRIYLFIATDDLIHNLNFGLPGFIEKNIRGVKRFVFERYLKKDFKLFREFDAFEGKVRIILYRDLRSLYKDFKRFDVDVVFPTTSILRGKCPIPWVGYLYDCQHRHLPEIFREATVKKRDRYFASMLNGADAVMVNARATKSDLVKFFNGDPERIMVLPFAPIADPAWFEDRPDSMRRYGLPPKYFVISNQFWVHKSHITAFEALGILKARGHEDLNIVCTGKMADGRDPDLLNKLKKRIKELNICRNVFFLGFIAKEDQMEVMKNSIAVLQPTLFEGGPGGGAVWNAASLGKPAIVSDIPVNLELRGKENMFFFKANDPRDLAEKMMLLLDNKLAVRRFSREELMRNSMKNLEALSTSISGMINKVMKKA